MQSTEVKEAEVQASFHKLCDVIRQHMAPGFIEGVQGNFITWTVAHSTYPNGYHCDPKQPLPFLSVATQKNFIAMYHMGLYSMPELLEWFMASWPKHSKRKLDMGKSCVRFKPASDIPYALIGELVAKVDATTWIGVYESHLKR